MLAPVKFIEPHNKDAFLESQAQQTDFGFPVPILMMYILDLVKDSWMKNSLVAAGSYRQLRVINMKVKLDSYSGHC